MKKHNLPKNWIVRTSSTYQNRVYYFNVATNQSSWVHPNSDPNIPIDETPTKQKMANKRKKPGDDGDSHEIRSTTPEYDGLSTTPRPKLKAKRILPSQNDEKNASSNDTPQMKALREKLQQRQAQGNAAKKSKIPKTTEIKESPIQKKRKKLTEPSEDLSKREIMTPQMQEFQEKLNSRKSLGPSTSKYSKVLPEKTDEGNITPEKRITRRSRARSISVHSEISETSSSELGNGYESPKKKSLTKKSRSSIIEENLKRMKTLEGPPGEPVKRILVDRDIELDNSSTSTISISHESETPKTNTARTRISNLRKSLAEKQKNEPSTSSTKSSIRKKPLSRTTLDPIVLLKRDSPPSIYKNANERMKNLRKRLSAEAESMTEKRRSLFFNKSSPTSPKEADSTLDTLIQGTDPCYEEMDWEPIEEEKIVFEIQSVRAQLNNTDTGVPETPMEVVSLNPLKLVPQDVTDSGTADRRVLYIVIDTNVFLTSLQSVEMARDAIFRRYGRPFIVIPWTVIRELDFIKDDRSNNRSESLKAKAREAIRFLHNHFSAKHPRVLSQTPIDVIKNRRTYQITCPDDEILQTCLQIRSTKNTVILLSYDTNLCNKAMVHDVVTLGRMDPLEKIDYLSESECRSESTLTTTLRLTGDEPQEMESILSKELALAEDLFEETTAMLTSFMTVIVAKEMENLFGDKWERLTIIQPPWTAITVLKCAIKHWIAAVNESFIRSAESIVKELHELIIKLQFNRRLKDVDLVIERCFDLIQSLKSEKYPNLMQKFSGIVKNLKNKSAEAMRQIQDLELKDKGGFKGNEMEQEMRATAAFRCFENVYAFARDLCGTAAEIMGMPCTFQYKKIDSLPALEDVNNLRPEIAANLNRLLQILSTAFEDIDNIHVNHRSVYALYDALVNFLPEVGSEIQEELAPLDVYWCLKRKTDSLKLGLGQLQELSSHFCRMASFKAT